MEVKEKGRDCCLFLGGGRLKRKKFQMEMTCAFGTPGHMSRCSNAQSVFQVANMLDAEPKKKKQIVIYKPNDVEIYDLQYGIVSYRRQFPRCVQQMEHHKYVVVCLSDDKTQNDMLRHAAVLARSQFVCVFKLTRQVCDTGFAWLGQNLLFVRGTDINDVVYIYGLEHDGKKKLQVEKC